MADDIQKRLRALVQKIAEKPIPQDPEESLFEGGVLDSFALTDVVGAIEEEFKIKIPDKDLTPRKFDSIARMETYITDHGA
ncbi:MAG TPA: acyl carrier protein [Bryobacteraceae bacterium]|jgi:acyl carrier protein